MSLSDPYVAYYVYEPNANASITYYLTRAEADAHVEESNTEWRKTEGIIWILWWLLNGCRMKYVVREEVRRDLIDPDLVED